MGCVNSCTSYHVGWVPILRSCLIPVSKQRKYTLANKFFAHFDDYDDGFLEEPQIRRLLVEYFRDVRQLNFFMYANEFGKRIAEIMPVEKRLSGVSYDVFLCEFDRIPEPFIDVVVELLDPENKDIRVIYKKAFIQNVIEIFLSYEALANEDEMNEILPCIFLGSEKAACNTQMLERNGITNILCIGWELRKPHEDHYKYLYYGNILDSAMQDLIYLFKDCHRFMEEAVVENRGKVLVHCQLGVSRSATILISWLMRLNNWTFQESYEWTKLRREYVDPNVGFQVQLMEFESKHCTYEMEHYEKFNLAQAIINRMDWGLREIQTILIQCETDIYERQPEMRYFTLLFASTQELHLNNKIMSNIQKRAVLKLRFFQTEFVQSPTSLESFDRMFKPTLQDSTKTAAGSGDSSEISI